MGSWTTVPTVSTGFGVTSAWGNQVKAATDIAGASRPRCRYSRTIGSSGTIGTSGGAVGNAARTPLDHVVFDNDGMTGTGDVAIKTTGVWLLTLTAEWISNGAAGYRTAIMYENTMTRQIVADQKVGVTGYSTYHYLASIEYLDNTDVIQARVAQSSGIAAYFATGLWGLSISAVLLSG